MLHFLCPHFSFHSHAAVLTGRSLSKLAIRPCKSSEAHMKCCGGGEGLELLTKVWEFKSVVITTLLYGSETWVESE